MSEDELTRDEAAASLRMSLRKLDELLAQRAITFRRQGRAIRIPRAAIDEFRRRTTIDAAS